MTYSVRVITQEVTTRHLTKLGSRALKFDMGPLVAAASLQHVAGIENSAMQLVLMRCSLDLTLNCEPCRLYTTRSWWLLVPQCLPCVIFIPIHVVEMCYGKAMLLLPYCLLVNQKTLFTVHKHQSLTDNVGLCNSHMFVCVCVCTTVLCNIVQWMTEIVFLLRVTVYNNLCKMVFTFNSAVHLQEENYINAM